MNLVLAPYLFTVYLSVSVCWFLAFYTWRRRRSTAALAFAAVMLFAGLWAAFYGLELITPSLEGKLLWFNVKRLFASFLGPCLLIFALEYTNKRVKYPRLLYIVLLIEPLVSQVIFWTNSRFGWGGTPFLVTDMAAFPLLVFEYGPWFWVSIFAGYLLFAISMMILLAQLPGANSFYRKQLFLILAGMLLPWLADVLSLLGLWQLEFFDVTIFLFPASGLLIVWGLIRYRFLELMPVAYSAVFSSIRDGILIVDDKFCVVESNPAALRLLDSSEQGLIGQPISKIIPVWDQSILQSTQFDETQPLEFCYEGNGQHRYLEIHGREVFNNTNLSTGHMIILYDVTDRKLAEQLLRQQAADLEIAVRAEQKRSAIILQSVNDAIAVSDLEIKMIFVNRAFSQLTGYSLEEVMGKHATFILNGRIPEHIMDSIRQTLINQVVWEGELQFRRKDGTVYDAAVLIAPMRDGLGNLVGYVSSHRDITESKRLEESRRHFITNISHELRTPVTNLRLYVDLLERQHSTTRKQQYFSTLNEQIKRLESIIQNSVEIISLENKQNKLLRQPIHWDILSEKLQARLQPRAMKKNVALHFDPQLAQLPIIVGDSQRIMQALYELIYNALNFTQAGGNVVISGNLQTENAEEWLTLSVCDNGPGIAPSEQSRIFDRFYRGQQVDTGHIPGTGLGLSIVSLIAQAHNGRLTLESRLGQGSTFTLWFPLN